MVDALGSFGIPGNGTRRFSENRIGLGHGGIVQEAIRPHARKPFDRRALRGGGARHEIAIPADVPTGRTVETVRELHDQLLRVERRVFHELHLQPDLHVPHVGADRRLVLEEHPVAAVRRQQAHVRRERALRRRRVARASNPAVRDLVVPHGDFVADAMPRLKVAAHPAVRGVAPRPTHVAHRIAQANADVAPRTDCARRPFGREVRHHLECGIGSVRFQCGGDGIGEIHQKTRSAALALNDRRAPGAAAEAVVAVVLVNCVEHRRLYSAPLRHSPVHSDVPSDAVYEVLAQTGVRKAELGLRR